MEKEAASLKTKKNVSNPKLDSLKPKAMKWKRKDFFCFQTCSFFFYFIACGLRLQGLSFEGVFFFQTCSFFFHFIAFGFRPSGLGFHGYFCLQTCSFLFHFIAFGLRPSGLGFHGFFLFLNLQLLFPFYCLCFKVVGFRVRNIFFCLQTCSFFFHFIALGLRPSGLRFHGFFLFFELQLLFPFYCLRFKAFGFRL